MGPLSSPPSAAGWLRARARRPRYAGIWVATALLFALSPLLAANSLTSSALLGMLPFAALLAIASIGQTLVVQQRGLDLTVPGMILLTAVILTLHANGSNARLPGAILLVILACVASGLASGLAVTRLGITPFVATLGVNALLMGVVYQLVGGQEPGVSPPDLASFAVHKSLGIPNTVLIAGGAVIVLALLLRATTPGRRFIAVGASPPAARAAGIRVTNYVVATYVVASLTYGATGVLLTGYLQSPGISAGSTYLLPTIAAVVLGGTSLAGGTGTIVGTAIGALFLTQLNQVVTANGAPQSVEFIIEGAIIAGGMVLRTVPTARLRRILLAPAGRVTPSVPLPAAQAPASDEELVPPAT